MRTHFLLDALATDIATDMVTTVVIGATGTSVVWDPLAPAQRQMKKSRAASLRNPTLSASHVV